MVAYEATRPAVANLFVGSAERREVKSSPAARRSAESSESSCAFPDAWRIVGFYDC